MRVGLVLTLLVASCGATATAQAPLKHVGVPQASASAAPLPRATVADNGPSAECASSCAAGFCWEGCPLTTVNVNARPLQVEATNERIAWVGGSGLFVLERGTHIPRMVEPRRVSFELEDDILVFGADGDFEIHRGHEPPVSFSFPPCRSDEPRMAVDANRVALMCVHVDADPRTHFLTGATFQIGLFDLSGHRLGAGTFFKVPDRQAMLLLFGLHGDAVVVNDENRIVALDLIHRAPLERVLTTIPAPFTPTSGRLGGDALHDVIGHPCEGLQCNVVGALDKAWLRSLDAGTTAKVPLSARFVKNYGPARIIESSIEAPAPHDRTNDYELATAELDGTLTLLEARPSYFVAAGARDGTSVVSDDHAIVIRSAQRW